MRFVITAAALVVCANAVRAQDTARFSAHTVAPGIYMLAQPTGGNVGLSVGSDGVFMIDDHLQALSPRLLEAVRAITPQPVRMLINTHFHYDHAGGNEVLGSAGTVIVAHDNVRRRLRTDYLFADFNSTQKKTAPVGLPIITFSRDVTFHLNGEELHAFHVRNAHTDGDAVVYFRNANVIHAGDVFFNGAYPYIDLGAGGSIDGMITAAARLVSLATAETKIIPGHGALADRADLVRYRDMMVATREAVRAAMRGGKTLAQVKAAKPTAPWDARWGQGFVKPDQYVETIYRSLKKP